MASGVCLAHRVNEPQYDPSVKEVILIAAALQLLKCSVSECSTAGSPFRVKSPLQQYGVIHI